MPYSLEMDGAILRIVFHGVFTNRDLTLGGDELDQLERSLSVVPHRIADLRPTTRLEINFEGVYALVVARRRAKFANPFKSAIVTSGVAHFGFARMFQTLNDHPQICIAIFGDEDEALSWLKTPGHVPPAVEWQPAWP